MESVMTFFSCAGGCTGALPDSGNRHARHWPSGSHCCTLVLSAEAHSSDESNQPGLQPDAPPAHNLHSIISGYMHWAPGYACP
jgi:hypothetical protein